MGIPNANLNVYSSARVWHSRTNPSELKVGELLEQVWVRISEGQLANLLIQKQDAFHHEKDALSEAGLYSSFYQHIDDTAMRMDGANPHQPTMKNREKTEWTR